MAKSEFQPKLKLKALREARGMSMRQLGHAIGRDTSVILRLEKGRAQYNETLLILLSRALGVHAAELLEDGESGSAAISRADQTPTYETKAMPASSLGFAEAGAEPFQYDPDQHPPLPPIAQTQSRYRVLNRDLSEKGYVPGQVITVDPRATWAKLSDGDAVLVTINGKMQLRQYIAPDLLMTNSSGIPTAIRISSHDVRLIGKIVGNIGW